MLLSDFVEQVCAVVVLLVTIVTRRVRHSVAIYGQRLFFVTKACASQAFERMHILWLPDAHGGACLLLMVQVLKSKLGFNTPSISLANGSGMWAHCAVACVCY
jgi:hypothetical protein